VPSREVVANAKTMYPEVDYHLEGQMLIFYAFLVSLCFVGSFAFLIGAWWASDHAKERRMKEIRSGYTEITTGNT